MTAHPPDAALADDDQVADHDRARATIQAAGIQCLRIPTPFAVGRVNTYLLQDDPLTLIDSGPNSGNSLDELEQALAVHGHAIEDIGLLVITHQHIDHVGLAAIIARRSGAEVAALDRLAPVLARYREDAERDDQFSAMMMLRHGIPRDVVEALRAVSAGFRAWGSSVEVTRPLADGSSLTLRDRTLRVHHRPGHSPSDTVFYDAERKILIGGDHLIRDISSNPLVSRPLPSADHAAVDVAGAEIEPETGDHGRRPQALVTYLDSLRATRAMEVDVVLAGHGDPFGHHAAVIDDRFALHERRARRILGLIAERPRSTYELAHQMWGNVAVTQAYLTLSEVLGHADLLLNAGSVRERVDDGVVRFELAQPPEPSPEPAAPA